MNKMLKYGLFVILFGVLACVNLACNTSAEAKNETDVSVAEVQELAYEEVANDEMQETEHKPIVISEEQFKQLVVDFTSNNVKFKGKKPCVIDFYADWCRPCKMLAPTLEKIAEKYGNDVNFYKVNVDFCKNLSAAYGITNIPTLFFYDKKGTLYKMVGVPSEEELENAIKTIL